MLYLILVENPAQPSSNFFITYVVKQALHTLAPQSLPQSPFKEASSKQMQHDAITEFIFTLAENNCLIKSYQSPGAEGCSLSLWGEKYDLFPKGFFHGGEEHSVKILGIG